MKLVAKKFGPLVVNDDDDGTIVFTSQADFSAHISPKPDSEGLSPTDLILASLGACLSLSMQMACKQLAVDVGATTFSLTAFKAIDKPSRIERFEVDVTMARSLEGHEQDQLLARTKEICTISHTLNADIVFNVAR